MADTVNECAVALYDAPSLNDVWEANRAFGDWIWVGRSEDGDKVAEAIANDRRFADAFELGMKVCVVPADAMTPAAFRRVKDRVRRRLEQGAVVLGADESVEVLVPIEAIETGARSWISWPVLVPDPSLPFPFHTVQAAAEAAEAVAPTSVLPAASTPVFAPGPVDAPLTAVPPVAGTAPEPSLQADTPPGSAAAHAPGLGPDTLAGQMLRVLATHDATIPETRMKLDAIAREIETRIKKLPDLKKVSVTLKRHGLTETARGSAGGCWLTAEGRAYAERLLAEYPW